MLLQTRKKTEKVEEKSRRDSFAKKEYCLNQEKLIEAILCEDDCKTERHGQFVFC